MMSFGGPNNFMDGIVAKPKARYIAGVDPGTQTGIGVYDRGENRLVYLTTTDFFGVADWFKRFVRISDLKVYVEVPTTFMYDRHEETVDKLRDRRMLLTGGVRREAQLLAESLRRQGFAVEEVEPIRSKKWNAGQFNQALKWARQSNQHERDAGRIAWVYANKR